MEKRTGLTCEHQYTMMTRIDFFSSYHPTRTFRGIAAMSSDTSAADSLSSGQATPQVAFCDLGAEELERSGAPPMNWLWTGYLAPGQVTLLTSQWKSGKTTL